MTFARFALVLTAVLLLGACAAAQPGSPLDDARKLRAGMFEDDARARLGSPQDTDTEADGSETWTYRYSESDEHGGNAILRVQIRNGRVATWSERLDD